MIIFVLSTVKKIDNVQYERSKTYKHDHQHNWVNHYVVLEDFIVLYTF